MPDKRITFLRGMLDRMDTRQLDEMLQAELEREQPDGNAVRMLLSVLEDREDDAHPETTPEVDAAWQQYIARTNSASKGMGRKPLLKAASVGVVLALLFAAVPQTAEAGNIWNRLVRWTSSVYELFSPDEERTAPEEYVFRTDNPGLQQVYDTLVAHGVAEPVVPMWIPEGYELVECRTYIVDTRNQIISSFSNSEDTIVFVVCIYNDCTNKNLLKNDGDVEICEMNGDTFNIFTNDKKWVVIWNKDNIECSFSINCQEYMLYDILRSIYEMEE